MLAGGRETPVSKDLSYYQKEPFMYGFYNTNWFEI